jgi:hypothetical protein
MVRRIGFWSKISLLVDDAMLGSRRCPGCDLNAFEEPKHGRRTGIETQGQSSNKYQIAAGAGFFECFYGAEQFSKGASVSEVEPVEEMHVLCMR